MEIQTITSFSATSSDPSNCYDRRWSSPSAISQNAKPKGYENLDLDDKKELGKAFNLTNALRHEYMAKNGSKIVNWMIKNDGKQTIIVL